MRRYLTRFVILTLVFTTWAVSFPTMAARADSQQTKPTKTSNSKAKCQVNDAALNAINKAKALVVKADTINKEALMLLEKAKKASRPPNCDGARARILADKASQLAEAATKSVGVENKVKHTRTLKTTTGTLSGCGEPIEFTSDGSTGEELFISVSTSTTSTTYGLGSTSGTYDCDSNAAYIEMQQYRFVDVAHDNLAEDMAQGSGEYVTTMAYLEGCPSAVHDRFAQMAQRNFNRIFSQQEFDPEVILWNLENQIAADPLLKAQCSEVS